MKVPQLDSRTSLSTGRLLESVSGLIVNQHSGEGKQSSISYVDLITPAHTIDYYYTYSLPGESFADVSDVHFHPIESRLFRVNLVANF